MKPLRLFNVAPFVPEPIAFLEQLAHNMWWCWNGDAIELFRRINPHTWRECNRNPIAFLSSIPQKRLEGLSEDEGFMGHLNRIKKQFEDEVLKFVDVTPEMRAARNIAYFSLEFGIHESIRIYSGGLGVLAGDHLKSASDLNVPLTGVSLLYRQGYFRQFLNTDGWQQESYPENELHLMPIAKARNNENQQVMISIPLPEGTLHAAVWRLDVGRVPLYMLDANIPENPPEFRKITATLYDSDKRTRLRQELLLGIGGVRALKALGYAPSVYHMNEGHAAFLGLQRMTDLCNETGASKEEAIEIVSRSSVFTTHTPVPAGNETFKLDLLRPHLEALKSEIKLDPGEIISAGQASSHHSGDEISMTVLGLRFARYRNGVSKLHGEIARKMWSGLWPDWPENEIPITHITNGIHSASWLSSDNTILFDRYIGPEWRTRAKLKEQQLPHINKIPDEELWRAHELARSRLIRLAREHLEHSLRNRNASRAEIAQAKGILDHDALTIGFARRFATYKRGTLLLRDPSRLISLLADEERPVQILFAGKAHPADDHGKDFIRQIVHFARRHNLQRKLIFLENYNINVARALVQGADVWLNTPRRPQEASGTSGMKAAVNGCINLSILDGWWVEGYAPTSGWAIGHGEEFDDTDYQDTVESQALFNLLENEVVPLFYDRQGGDLPAKWLKMMKASIKMALGQFTSHRMVAEYSGSFYKPAAENFKILVSDKYAKAASTVKQRQRLHSLWHAVRLSLPVTDQDISSMHVGDKFTVSTEVHLGSIDPSEVEVQIYYGRASSQNQITESDSRIETMTQAESKGDGVHIFKHEITCTQSGRYGFTARVVAAGDELKGIIPGFVAWANGIIS